MAAVFLFVRIKNKMQTKSSWELSEQMGKSSLCIKTDHNLRTKTNALHKGMY